MLREKEKRTETDKRLREKVSIVLAQLAEQGYLQRNQFSWLKKSTATITPKGMCVVEKLIKPLLDAMQDGRTLKDWREILLPKVQRRLPFFAEQTAALYYPLSKSQEKQDRLDRLAKLREILQSDGCAVTVNQLARKLRVSKTTISSYLRELSETYPITMRVYKDTEYYHAR